jgi:hypothetical protein
MSANFPRLDTLDSFIMEPSDLREAVVLYELDPPARYAKVAESHGLQVLNTLYRRILQGSKYNPPQPPVLIVNLQADKRPNGRERAQNLLDDFTSWVKHLRIYLTVPVPQLPRDQTPVIQFQALDWLIPVLERAVNLDSWCVNVVIQRLDGRGNVIHTSQREVHRHGNRLHDFLHGTGSNPLHPGRTLRDRMEELLTDMLAAEGIWNIDQIRNAATNRANGQSDSSGQA